MRGYQRLELPTDNAPESVRRQFAEDVLVGLSERPRRLSSKWFYDDRGSRLFARITDLDAYYPTACEREVFERHAADILDRFRGQAINLVDLGAGDGRKTAVLLRHLVDRDVDVRYVPIDISEGAMAGLLESMGQRLPTLPIAGLVSEYFQGIRWLADQTDRVNVVLLLGSNIGNFDKPRARAFLRRLWNAMNAGDHALIGFDLKKDIEVLLTAYNDPQGVTAAFNLNLLNRINRELGGDFDVKRFRHYGTYNVFSGAMESYLVSKEAQTVHIEALRDQFTFEPWEPIHTEYSYKYLTEDIEDLGYHAGFDDVGLFTDSRGWFCDALWRARG